MASVTLEIQDALAVVTISNSPLNLFTWEMLDELSDIIDQVAAAPLRALLLKANGQHFSAGADVPAMFERLSTHAAEAHLVKHIPAHGTPAGASNSDDRGRPRIVPDCRPRNRTSL